MGITEKIKNAIIEKYNKLNEKSPFLIDLDKPAVDIEDPFMKEYKKALLDSVRSVNDSHEHEKVPGGIKDQIDGELTALYGEDEVIDPSILSSIEMKVNGILKKLRMEFYETRKESLKELLASDIEKTEPVTSLDDTKKQIVFDLVNDLIEHEIAEYKSKKDYRKKELLKDYLQKTNPLVNRFFEKNNHEILVKMTLFQRKNLLNYFFEEINHKFIQPEFLNKNIDELEFKFLKSRIYSFIESRYNKTLNEKLHD